jgi:hypothetical protein
MFSAARGRAAWKEGGMIWAVNWFLLDQRVLQQPTTAAAATVALQCHA